MKEIKYRAWDKINKEMYEVQKLYFENGILTHVGIDCEKLEGTIQVISIKHLELLQYTGLHDNTKWEQLSDVEKKEFYSKHCSEDGRTIKYQDIGDVKHLWSGKYIYEGYILGDIFSETYIAYCDKCKQFELYSLFDNKCLACSGDVHWCELVEHNNKLEVKGNIYENKNLLSS